MSLGVVTASMAHEFNNPLGIVMGFTQELLNECEPDSRNYQALKIIDEETRRCQKIIQELLQAQYNCIIEISDSPFVELLSALAATRAIVPSKVLPILPCIAQLL